jgi:hypothetical protein
MVMSRLMRTVAQGAMVAALLMQDFDYNVFLVSMKRPGYFLGYEKDIVHALSEVSRKVKGDHEIVVRTRALATDLLLKIQQGMARKDDFDSFLGFTYALQTGKLKKAIGGRTVSVSHIPPDVLRKHIQEYLGYEDDVACLKIALTEMVMIGLMAEHREADEEERQRRLKAAYDAYGLV